MATNERAVLFLPRVINPSGVEPTTQWIRYELRRVLLCAVRCSLPGGDRQSGVRFPQRRDGLDLHGHGRQCRARGSGTAESNARLPLSTTTSDADDQVRALLQRLSKMIDVAFLVRKAYPRTNQYELANHSPQPSSSFRNDLEPHPENGHHLYIQNGHKGPSERYLRHDRRHQTHAHPTNVSDLPITTSPLWSTSSPLIAGSQPNLAFNKPATDFPPFHRRFIPRANAEANAHLRNPLYASTPDNRSDLLSFHQRKPSTAQQHLIRKQKTQSQYFDTNEFILCASNGQPLRHGHRPDRQASRDHRPHSMNVNGSALDVYY